MFKIVADEIWYYDIKVARFEGGWPTLQDRAREYILEISNSEERELEIEFEREQGFKQGHTEGYDEGIKEGCIKGYSAGYEAAKKDLWVKK